MDEPAASQMFVTFVPDTGQPGKKRARNVEPPAEGSPKKRAKTDTPKKIRPARHRLPRPAKVNAAAKAALKERLEKALATEPKWKTLPLAHLPKSQTIPSNAKVTELRPRLWTSDKEELLAILPEMSGKNCINGVSWMLYDTPLLILDDTTAFFQVQKVDDLVMDIITTRSFTLPVSPAPQVDTDESLSTMTLVQPSERFEAPMESFIPSLENHDRNGDEPHVPLVKHQTTVPVKKRKRKSSKTNDPEPLLDPSFSSPLIPNSSHSFTAGASIVQASSIGESLNLSTLTPESFQHPDAVSKLVGMLKDGIFLDPVPRIVALVDQLPSAVASDLFYQLATALGVEPIPDAPPSIPIHHELHSLIQVIQRRKEKSRVIDPPWIQNGDFGTHVDSSHRNVKLADGYSHTSLPAIMRSHDARVPPHANQEAIPPSLAFENGEALASSQPALPLPMQARSLAPSPIPQDLQALVDAYINGRPLRIICSNKRLYDHWSLLLPQEYGYAMMGFFRIIGIEENKLQTGLPKLTPAKLKGFSSGQVCWRLRLCWSPGGESSIYPNSADGLQHAWWSPPPTSTPSNTAQIVESVSPRPLPEPEDEFPTVPRYRELRKNSHEYQWRHDPLEELYYYLFPPHLLVSFTSQLPDNNFPRGWICSVCGRMNFQKAIRHRKCPGHNPSCKESGTKSYYLDLFLLRDPQDRLTLPLPCNVYPGKGVKVKHAKWDDGTQTFSCLMPADAEKPTSYIKHIFTGNLTRLQKQANDWLERVQLELELVRKCGDNGPYFSYSKTCPKAIKNANVAKWPNVPDFVNEMKDALAKRALLFAEMNSKDLHINQFEILAWVTSGQKKYPKPITAKKKAIVIHCLGCNTALIVVPRSSKVGHGSAHQPVEIIDEKEENVQGNSGWIDNSGADEHERATVVAHNLGQSPKKKSVPVKKDPQAFTFSLVHGDTLVLFGDDFDYTIKRDGTAFLLMGSCADVQ